MELVNFIGFHKNKNKSHILLAKEGNKDAFTDLIQSHLDSMYRVAKGILKSEADVEDAIQNTILIVFNKLNTLKDESLFKTWLTKILINECNKIYSKNKRTTLRIEEDTYTMDNHGEMDLYHAINKLPEELKITTILFYFDDMSQKEISKVLNIAEGTVKSRLFRAKEKLYLMLKEKN